MSTSKYLNKSYKKRMFDLVILAHGMGRTSFSMKLLESPLEKQGYEVFNWNYNGWFKSVSKLTDEAHHLLNSLQSDQRINNIYIVAHSLGNIVMRSALSEKHYSKVKRMVMLAPPNQGSQKANELSPAIGWLLKPISDLKVNSMRSGLGISKIKYVEIGVLIGDKDPVVKVAESYLPEAKEIKIVKSYHTFIMNRRNVQKLVLNFLKNGKFD